MYPTRKGRYDLFTYDGRCIGDTFATSARDAVTNNPGAYYAKVCDVYTADGRPISAGRK